MLGEVGVAYKNCRLRITDLVGELDEQLASTTVPACPAWSVHDVVAHLAGNLADALAGRLDGAGTEERTADQVNSRRAVPLPQILDEWTADALEVEELIDGAGEIGRQGVADVVSHEHDIRGALGVPGARDTDAINIGLTFVGTRLIDTAIALGVALQIRATNGLEIGPDAADVVLSGESFELLRAVTGRRSVDQLREMEWKGDCDTVIPAFWWPPLLQPATTRIDE